MIINRAALKCLSEKIVRIKKFERRSFWTTLRSYPENQPCLPTLFSSQSWAPSTFPLWQGKKRRFASCELNFVRSRKKIDDESSSNQAGWKDKALCKGKLQKFVVVVFENAKKLTIGNGKRDAVPNSTLAHIAFLWLNVNYVRRGLSLSLFDEKTNCRKFQVNVRKVWK